MNKGISLLAQFPPFLHRTEVSRSSVSHTSRRFLTTRITLMFKVGIRKEMQVTCLKPINGSVQGSYFFKVTKQVQQHTPSKEVFMLPAVHQSHNYILLGRLRTRKHPNALPLVLSKSYFILLSTDIKLKGRRRKRGWEQRKETSLILLLSVLPPPILFPLKKQQKTPRIHVANNTNYFNISLFQ